MENRIKEQQLGLFADRTSAHRMRVNQIRPWLASLAYVLIARLRKWGLRGTEWDGTEWARAQIWTLRSKLLKIGVLVKVSVRRVFPMVVGTGFRDLEALPEKGTLCGGALAPTSDGPRWLGPPVGRPPRGASAASAATFAVEGEGSQSKEDKAPASNAWRSWESMPLNTRSASKKDYTCGLERNQPPSRIQNLPSSRTPSGILPFK